VTLPGGLSRRDPPTAPRKLRGPNRRPTPSTAGKTAHNLHRCRRGRRGHHDSPSRAFAAPQAAERSAAARG